MMRSWLAGLALALVPATAFGGPYLSLSGAAVFLEDADLDGDGESGELEFDPGFGIIAAAGYGFDEMSFGRFRVEAEFAYRQNDIDQVRAFGQTFSGGDAEMRVLSGMVNGALDISTGTIVTPYILAGIGGANINLESDDNDFDENDGVFAYQAGAGLGFAITEQITLFAGYRFFGTTDPEFDGVDAEYNSHNLEGGLRFEF